MLVAAVVAAGAVVERGYGQEMMRLNRGHGGAVKGNGFGRAWSKDYSRVGNQMREGVMADLGVTLNGSFAGHKHQQKCKE